MNKYSPSHVLAVLLFNHPKISKTIEDERYLKTLYRGFFGRKLDLDNPKTFNEKMQWLKLYDKNPLYTRMVDKYEAKKYVASIIGEEHIVPTIGVWDCFEEIDFGALPNQFVLKCTHDSGGLVIVRDKTKFDVDNARKKINKCLKREYYYLGREWPYKNVKPRIIAEKYLEDSKKTELRDYKFFCFNGVAKCFKVDFDRFINHRANYYDFNYNTLSIGEVFYPPVPDKEISFPNTVPLMKKYAEKLSANIPFIRVDFYDVNDNVYFGELTFFPSSGFGRFVNDDSDDLLGSWIELPNILR